MLYYKTFREKRENLEDLGLSKEFLDLTPKAWSIKKKKINWIIQNENLLFWERDCEGDKNTRRKYLLIT